MKIYNIDGDLVQTDIRPSKRPVKFKSRSILQKAVGERLEELYPRDTVLEDFTIPGSRLSVDFFLPKREMVVEVNGRQHDEYVPHFHGPKSTAGTYGTQISNDRQKAAWAEMNNFKWVEIRTEADLDKLNA